MNNGYETFKKYEVKADSIKDFLDKYYKRDRFYGRGQEYTERLIKSYEEEFKKFGYCIISHHDNVTGQVVAYYGNSNQRR